jgi:hypothetical protein
MAHDQEAATAPVVRLLWQVSTLKPETPNCEVLAPEEVGVVVGGWRVNVNYQEHC